MTPPTTRELLEQINKEHTETVDTLFELRKTVTDARESTSQAFEHLFDQLHKFEEAILKDYTEFELRLTQHLAKLGAKETPSPADHDLHQFRKIENERS